MADIARIHYRDCDQELLLCNEYVVTANRMLRNQMQGRVRLSDGERKALAEIGQKLGKKALKEVATIVTPAIILAWYCSQQDTKRQGPLQCRERLGGLLKYYTREAA